MFDEPCDEVSVWDSVFPLKVRPEPAALWVFVLVSVDEIVIVLASVLATEVAPLPTNFTSSLVVPLWPVPLNLNLIPLEDTTEVEYRFCVFVSVLVSVDEITPSDEIDTLEPAENASLTSVAESWVLVLVSVQGTFTYIFSEDTSTG